MPPRKLVIASVLVAAGVANAEPRQQPSDTGSRLGERLNPFPRPTKFHIRPVAQWYVTGAVFCAAGGLIAGAAAKPTELTNEEAETIAASCFLPVIGGVIVHALYARHPKWNLLKGTVIDREKADLMKQGIGQ